MPSPWAILCPTANTHLVHRNSMWDTHLVHKKVCWDTHDTQKKKFGIRTRRKSATQAAGGAQGNGPELRRFCLEALDHWSQAYPAMAAPAPRATASHRAHKRPPNGATLRHMRGQSARKKQHPWTWGRGHFLNNPHSRVSVPTCAAMCAIARALPKGGVGGWGTGTQKLMYHKWPNQIFPIVKFRFFS